MVLMAVVRSVFVKNAGSLTMPAQALIFPVGLCTLPLVVVLDAKPLTYSSSPPQHSKICEVSALACVNAQTMSSELAVALLSAILAFETVWKLYSVPVSNIAVALGAFG